MTHTNDVSVFHSQLLESREAYHIINEPSFEVEDLFGQWMKQKAICMRCTYSYRKGKALLCGFLHTWYMRGWRQGLIKVLSIFSSQFSNYQNHKSLELGIVVKRVVLVFVILLLLYCCCSPVVQQEGCCPFVLSFVVRVCYVNKSKNQSKYRNNIAPEY